MTNAYRDLRVDLVRTNGIFSLDGQDFEVENNVWLVGNDDQVLVIDAAHDAVPIIDAVGDRALLLIVSTHGHNDHINAARSCRCARGRRWRCIPTTPSCGRASIPIVPPTSP